MTELIYSFDKLKYKNPQLSGEYTHLKPLNGLNTCDAFIKLCTGVENALINFEANLEKPYYEAVKEISNMTVPAGEENGFLRCWNSLVMLLQDVKDSSQIVRKSMDRCVDSLNKVKSEIKDKSMNKVDNESKKDLYKKQKEQADKELNTAIEKYTYYTEKFDGKMKPDIKNKLEEKLNKAKKQSLIANQHMEELSFSCDIDYVEDFRLDVTKQCFQDIARSFYQFHDNFGNKLLRYVSDIDRFQPQEDYQISLSKYLKQPLKLSKVLYTRSESTLTQDKLNKLKPIKDNEDYKKKYEVTLSKLAFIESQISTSKQNQDKSLKSVKIAEDILSQSQYKSSKTNVNFDDLEKYPMRRMISLADESSEKRSVGKEEGELIRGGGLVYSRQFTQNKAHPKPAARPSMFISEINFMDRSLDRVVPKLEAMLKVHNPSLLQMEYLREIQLKYEKFLLGLQDLDIAYLTRGDISWMSATYYQGPYVDFALYAHDKKPPSGINLETTAEEASFPYALEWGARRLPESEWILLSYETLLLVYYHVSTIASQTEILSLHNSDLHLVDHTLYPEHDCIKYILAWEAFDKIIGNSSEKSHVNILLAGNNITTIKRLLTLFRLKHGLSSRECINISKLMLGEGCLNSMGSYSNIHPLDIRWRAIRLLDIWCTISDLDDTSTKNWILRQIHTVHCALTFKIVRLQKFLPTYDFSWMQDWTDRGPWYRRMFDFKEFQESDDPHLTHLSNEILSKIIIALKIITGLARAVDQNQWGLDYYEVETDECDVTRNAEGIIELISLMTSIIKLDRIIINISGGKTQVKIYKEKKDGTTVKQFNSEDIIIAQARNFETFEVIWPYENEMLQVVLLYLWRVCLDNKSDQKFRPDCKNIAQSVVLASTYLQLLKPSKLNIKNNALMSLETHGLLFGYAMWQEIFKTTNNKLELRTTTPTDCLIELNKIMTKFKEWIEEDDMFHQIIETPIDMKESVNIIFSEDYNNNSAHILTGYFESKPCKNYSMALTIPSPVESILVEFLFRKMILSRFLVEVIKVLTDYRFFLDNDSLSLLLDSFSIISSKVNTSYEPMTNIHEEILFNKSSTLAEKLKGPSPTHDLFRYFIYSSVTQMYNRTVQIVIDAYPKDTNTDFLIVSESFDSKLATSLNSINKYMLDEIKIYGKVWKDKLLNNQHAVIVVSTIRTLLSKGITEIVEHFLNDEKNQKWDCIAQVLKEINDFERIEDEIRLVSPMLVDYIPEINLDDIIDINLRTKYSKGIEFLQVAFSSSEIYNPFNAPVMLCSVSLIDFFSLLDILISDINSINIPIEIQLPAFVEFIDHLSYTFSNLCLDACTEDNLFMLSQLSDNLVTIILEGLEGELYSATNKKINFGNLFKRKKKKKPDAENSSVQDDVDEKKTKKKTKVTELINHFYNNLGFEKNISLKTFVIFLHNYSFFKKNLLKFAAEVEFMCENELQRYEGHQELITILEENDSFAKKQYGRKDKQSGIKMNAELKDGILHTLKNMLKQCEAVLITDLNKIIQYMTIMMVFEELKYDVFYDMYTPSISDRNAICLKSILNSSAQTYGLTINNCPVEYHELIYNSLATQLAKGWLIRIVAYGFAGNKFSDEDMNILDDDLDNLKDVGSIQVVEMGVESVEVRLYDSLNDFLCLIAENPDYLSNIAGIKKIAAIAKAVSTDESEVDDDLFTHKVKILPDSKDSKKKTKKKKKLFGLVK